MGNSFHLYDKIEELEDVIREKNKIINELYIQKQQLQRKYNDVCNKIDSLINIDKKQNIILNDLKKH